MDIQTIENLEKSILTLENKEARIYFFVQDTKGNAKASIRYIYDFAMVLKNKGYNPIMLHEQSDYTSTQSWAGEKYLDLPHQPIEGGNLAVRPEDLLVIPEIFAFVMEQVKNLPCGKVVLTQAYDHIFETLQPGVTWADYGFLKCITTSENLKKYISVFMKNCSVDVVEPKISEVFTKQEAPAKPIVCVHSREQRDGINLIKQFYLRFPQYRWITFRDMRGLNESDFSKSLKDSFVSVWIDPTSSWGSFPLESMKSGVPVIGLVPNMVPSWMDEKNGVWVQKQGEMLDVIADFVLNWLEDNITDELYKLGSETAEQFSDDVKFENQVLESINGIFEARLNNFKSQLESHKETV